MNFKFDNENPNIDLSLGGDNGVEVPKKRPQPNNTQRPVPQQGADTQRPTQQRPVQRQNTGPTPQQNAGGFPQRNQQPNSGQPAQRPQIPQQVPQQKPVQQRTTQLPQTQQTPSTRPQAPVTPRPVVEEYVQPTYEPEPQRSFEETVYNDHQSLPDQNFDYSYPSTNENYGHEQNNRQQSQQFVPSPPSYEAPKPIQQYDEEENTKKGKARNSKAKSKPIKNDKDKEPKLSGLRGGRKNVLIVKIAIAAIIAILCGFGIKNLFFPDQFPSPAAVVSVVRDNLGVTKFPTDRATSFVTDFTRTYFTYTQGSNSDRDESLKRFAAESVLAAMPMKVTNPTGAPLTPQTLVAQPLVTGVDSVDDNNAVFTVQVQLSSGSTMLFSVPVYYDEKKDAMAISAPASVLPSISLAEVPQDNHAITWANDDAVVSAFEPDLQNYLTAWAASNQDVMKRYLTTDSSLVANTGLGGTVVFNTLDDLKVQLKDEKTGGDLTERQAYFSVVWADPKAPNVTYTQSYLLEIVQQPDKKWYIRDITSVITPEIEETDTTTSK